MMMRGTINMVAKSVRLFLVFSMLLICSLPIYSSELTEEYMANPFDPIVGDSGGGHAMDGSAAEYSDLHPLLQSPVSSYILMGVIVAPTSAVALVREPSGQEFFIHTGDMLGNNGGVITVIFSSGIEVEEGEEIFMLNVRNRSASFEKDES